MRMMPMCMMPRAAPCASVSMHIVHAGGARGVSGTIPGLWRLSSTCFLLLNFFLFSSCSLGFYGGLTSAFFLSESLAVGCVQHSFLHFTQPNTYVAMAQLRCPPPTLSSIDVLV